MSKRWFFAATFLAFLVALYFGTSGLRTPVTSTRLSVHFIDVGQGDAILIATASGKAVLVDGGSEPEGKTVCDYLSNEHIGHLNAVILTHPHADHVGGLVQVLDRFSVDRVYDVPQDQGLRAYRSFLRAIEDKGIRFETVEAGTSLDLDNDTTLEFLGPPSLPIEGTEADTNNNSVVLRVTCDEVSYLLLGDIQKDGVEELLRSGHEVKAQVVKIPHHGSMQATSDALIQAVSPHWAVISVGEGNDYEYPHPETLRRLLESGVRVLRTDLNGTIILSTDGRHIREVVEKNP